MSQKIVGYFSMMVLLWGSAWAQNWQPIDGKWTDKNKNEQHVAYLIRNAYYEEGYCGAKVEIKQDGSKRLFIVEPGEVFHLDKVLVLGLRAFPSDTLMEGGPKPGDIFSPTRINAWLEQVRNKYTKGAGPLESVMWGAKFDYAQSQVDVQVTVKERN